MSEEPARTVWHSVAVRIITVDARGKICKTRQLIQGIALFKSEKKAIRFAKRLAKAARQAPGAIDE